MTTLRIDPPAEWMTPAAFLPGGLVAQTVDQVRRAQGPRVLELWQRDVTRFADGEPITTAIIERHARQSLHHWAIHVAACAEATERRTRLPERPALRVSSGPTPPPEPARRNVTSSTKPWQGSFRAKFGWGRR